MKCPACTGVLSEENVDGVVLDICKEGCGGVWFDQFEFQKMDEPHESAGEKILQFRKESHVDVDHSKRYICPTCEKETIMMRRFFSVKREVELDECPRCGGIWLDPGELALLRSLFSSEEERREEAKKYFGDIFGGELSKIANENKEGKQKARRLANIFKFMCPSAYIPGDQEGGAF